MNKGDKLEIRPSLLKKPKNWFLIFGFLSLAVFLKVFYEPEHNSLGDEIINTYGWIVAIILGCYMILDKFYDKYTTKYYISESEVRVRYGFISMKATSITPQKINTIHLEQSILERIVGVGHLHIKSQGDEPEIIIYGIRDPVSIRSFIENQA